MDGDFQNGGSDAEARFVDDALHHDTVFLENEGAVSSFRFDSTVARAFDDMANRSIPLYAETQRLTARILEHIAKPGTRVYDLGCSTGTSLLFAASRLGDPSIEIIGVDSSQPMLDRCRERLSAHGFSERVALAAADILDYPLANASGVVLHYTLQFLPVPRRLDLLHTIHRALVPGGVLILSEKAVEGEQPLDAILTGLYYDFKKRNGYSELEIARKREALENVLIPLSLDRTVDLLREAGFTRVRLLSKCFQFCTFVAYNEF